MENRKAQAAELHRQSISEALREALGHSGYMLLCSGYFVCGFQLMFISVPVAPLTVYLFSASIGFLWLGTVPVTSGLIAHIFGARYLSTLSGIAFLFHQVGSFLGVWIAAYLFDTTGSYNLMWKLTIGMGIAAALINWPINERQIMRVAPKPA